MKENKSHIDQLSHRNYPTPDIPVEEAWEEMGKMLDADMLSPISSNAGFGSKFIGMLWKPALLLIGISCLIYWYISSTNNDKTTLSVNNNPSASSSIRTPQPDLTNSLNRLKAKTTEIKLNFDKELLKTKLNNQETKIISKQNGIGIMTLGINDCSDSRTDVLDSSKTENRRNEDKNKQKTSEITNTKDEVIINNISTGNDLKVYYGEESNIKNSGTSAKIKHQKIKSAKKNPELSLQFHYGIQWNVNLKFQNANVYFTDTNGKSLPYSLLIPDLWVSEIFRKRHELLLHVNPDQQYLTGNKTLSSYTGQYSVTDSALVMGNTILTKIGGIEIGAQYNYYHIYNKWSLGAGVNYYLPRKALMNRHTIGMINNTILSDSFYSIRTTSSEWQVIRSSVIIGRLEATYRINNVRIGGALSLSFTNILSIPNFTSLPINGLLFIRWQLK